MNALFLVGIAAMAFFFGYRFFAKLLALGIFRSSANYSPEVSPPADAAPSGGTHRHLLLVHHAVVLTSGATVVGSVVALGWGWIPALLWIVIGTAVAGGTLNMGALWLGAGQHRASLREFVAGLGGRLLGMATVVTALVMLTLLAALCTVIAAKLLVNQPTSALPVLIVLTLGWLLGRLLRHRSGLDVLPVAVIALVVALALMWFGIGYPVSLSGALNVDVAGSTWFSMTALVTWVLVVAVFGFVASHASPTRLAQPYALLNILLLASLIVVMLAGLLIERPTLTTPEFHTPTDAPSLFPWLFILLSSGAVAGLAFIMSVTTTAPRLPDRGSVRYVGYGGAIIEGIVALSVVLLASVAYSDAEIWKQNLGQWPALLDVGNAVTIYIEGFTRLGGALDIDAGFARTIGATVVIGLCLTTLEAVMRMLTAIAADATAPLALGPTRDLALRRVAASVLVAVLALGSVVGSGATLLIYYGVTSLMLAALGFALLAIRLRAVGSPVFIAAIPGTFVAVVVLWFIFERMTAWWSADRWAPFLAGIGLLAVLGAVALALARAFRAPPAPPA